VSVRKNRDGTQVAIAQKKGATVRFAVTKEDMQSDGTVSCAFVDGAGSETSSAFDVYWTPDKSNPTYGTMGYTPDLKSGKRVKVSKDTDGDWMIVNPSIEQYKTGVTYRAKVQTVGTAGIVTVKILDSNDNTPGGNVSVYVFLDNDGSTNHSVGHYPVLATSGKNSFVSIFKNIDGKWYLSRPDVQPSESCA